MAEQGPVARCLWGAALLGFALGGFFDGILLHQILQWHHLLSLVDGAADLRDQILFDGLFHLFMYLVALGGLLLLWRGRPALSAPGSARLVLANGLVGFGLWHVADALLSHWLLGIHRIRLDVPDPLVWDLAWLSAFGILPLLFGIMMRRQSGGHGTGGLMALVLALLVAGTGLAAAQPPTDSETAVVLFPTSMSAGESWNAIDAAEADVLWQARGVWAVRWRSEARAPSLYRRGALLVSTSLAGAACLGWARA